MDRLERETLVFHVTKIFLFIYYRNKNMTDIFIFNIIILIRSHVTDIINRERVISEYQNYDV